MISFPMNVSYVRFSSTFPKHRTRKLPNPYFSLFSAGESIWNVSPLQRGGKTQQTKLSASSGLSARTAEMTTSYFYIRCIFSEVVSIHISKYVANICTTYNTAGDPGRWGSLANHQGSLPVHSRTGLRPNWPPMGPPSWDSAALQVSVC